MKKYDVVALGELLIDFTENGISENGNPILEANPGGAPCNVLSMLNKLGRKTAFIGKVGNDSFGKMLAETVLQVVLTYQPDFVQHKIPTTLAFVHTFDDGEREFSFYRNPGADVMSVNQI
jgi:fructokinase